jgi:type IV fimbrial biogenesis protein FimT
VAEKPGMVHTYARVLQPDLHKLDAGLITGIASRIRCNSLHPLDQDVTDNGDRDRVMQNEKGFSLVEVIVTLGISALMLSMAVPSMGTFLSNSRQTGAINNFVASIRMARSTAIEANTDVTICPSAGGRNCESVEWHEGWIVFKDLDNNQVVDGDDTIVRIYNRAEGVEIRPSQAEGFLHYRPNGRIVHQQLSGSAGDFTVCDSRGADFAKVMILDLSGRPLLTTTLTDGSLPGCG